MRNGGALERLSPWVQLDPCHHLPLFVRSVEEGLTYRFHAAWDGVLQVLEVFFEVCGKQCHPIMRKVSEMGRLQGQCALVAPCSASCLSPQCLQSLCDLRLSPHFPYTTEVDQAVGAAVGAMGPEVLLEAVPLQIDGKE